MEKQNGKIKFFEAVALLVGGMIGSAIFSMSGLTISFAGPSAIISWIVAAIIQLFYGLAMVELATRYKKNGGLFIFPENAFDGEKGELIGFISTWGNTMADIISIAFSAMYIGRYLSFGFNLPENLMLILAIFSVIICFILNTFNISITSRINFTLAFILAILLISYSIIVVISGKFSFDNFTPFFTQGIAGDFGFVKSLPIAMIAYSSIVSISFISDEIENPKKNIPRAVVVGLFLVMFIYTFVIFATTGAMNTKELIDSDMVMIPLFAVCLIKLPDMGLLSKILSIAAVIALVTTMLVVMAVSSRNIKAVADRGLLPKIFGRLGKTNTPIYTLAILTIFGVALSFFPNTINILINLGALFILVTVIINFLSFLFSRKENKGSENCFIAPFHSIVAIIILLILIGCYITNIISGGCKLLIFSLSWYIIGIIIYIVSRRNNKNSALS